MADPGKTASKCPVCSCARSSIYVNGRNVDLTLGAIGSSRIEVSAGRVLRCHECRHGFREGAVSDAELGALYERMDVTRYEAEEPFRLATARRHLRLIRSSKVCGRCLLDVGCASGLFLEQVGKEGWQVSGVEPNRELAAIADERLGVGKVLCATLAEARLEPDTFDVITAWDVLEHVSNPSAFLQNCARLLKPGGVIWVKVPDIESLQARLMGARWPIYLPEHLGYFTKKSLGLCAKAAGLRVVRIARSPVTFSLGYVFFRAAQHGVYLAGFILKMVQRSGLARAGVALRLGEMYACLVPEDCERHPTQAFRKEPV